MRLFNVRAAAAAGLAALAIFAATWPHARAAVPRSFTVNITDTGFDPPLCKISRSDTVNWKNVGTKPHRVIAVNPTGGEPTFDSGDLAPGETSLPNREFEYPNQWRFKDNHNPAATGIVMTPVWSNDWQPSCEPLGITPAPVIPRGCEVPFYCAIAPALAVE